MSELLSQLQQLGDGEIDDLSIAHDASEEIVALRLRVAGLVDALTELCDEIDNHDIHSAISKTNILWFKRKARAALAAHEEELFCVRQDRDAHFGELMRALEQVDELQAECEKLRKNAERYRWLRNAIESGPLVIASVGGWSGLESWSGDDPDSAIDAARAAGGEQ